MDGQSISHLPGSFLLPIHHMSGTRPTQAQTVPPIKSTHGKHMYNGKTWFGLSYTMNQGIGESTVSRDLSHGIDYK